MKFTYLTIFILLLNTSLYSDVIIKGKLFYQTRNGDVLTLEGSTVSKIIQEKEGTFPEDVKFTVEGLDVSYFNKEDESNFSFDIGGKEVTVDASVIKLKDDTINYIYIDKVKETLESSDKPVDKDNVPLVIFKTMKGKVVESYRLDATFLKKIIKFYNKES